MNLKTSTSSPAPRFEYSPRPVLEPQAGSPWASTMVLNPALIKDPAGRLIHMLFRASGPGLSPARPGQPAPYPIFLGYAWSDDEGQTWHPDFSRPALAPALKESIEDMYVVAWDGQKRVNHANGCIEDPRLHFFEGACYLTTACRLFAPGPYWEHDEPMQCAPDWARTGQHPFGRAASENLTVTVLYQVDLDKLRAKQYEHAFRYVTHLTDPERGDNRDVFLFPRPLRIDGEPMMVCVHRPQETEKYARPVAKPRSIVLAAARTFEELPSAKARHELLAEPLFEWEGDRVGGSWPPIELEAGTWLLPYHGKQDAKVGYTQSFMILKEQASGFPKVIHRCSERLMYAHQDWELAGKFPTPCLFTCGGIVSNQRLLMSYGAADTKAGIASVGWAELVAYIKRFDPLGKKTA